jgi:ABC-type glycerol-3-phosphate transport system substrate-binding protein
MITEKPIFIPGTFSIFIICLHLTACFPAAPGPISSPSKDDAFVPYREASYGAYLDAKGYGGQVNAGPIALSLAGEMEVSTEGESLSWTFDCDSPGFYNIFIEYIPLPGIGALIERRLYLDGIVPFKGMEQLVFNRIFDNTGGREISQAKNGNEIRARSEEIFEWTSIYLEDSQKRGPDPYLVYLSQGSHTFTLEPLKGAMAIRRIEFRAAPVISPYAETLKTTVTRSTKYTGEPLVYQAERIHQDRTLAVLKSAQSIRNESDYTSVDTIPYHPWQIRLNVIGGSSWRVPGDILAWDIEVPQEGFYGLSFRAAQNINRGITSYRRLYINGETPCAETREIGFDFSTGYRQYDLSEDGLYFYFHKGKNRVALENVLGNFAAPLSTVEESLVVLNDLYLRTSQVTGLVPDKFIDYEIAAKVRDFVEILQEQSAILYGVVDDLVRKSGEKNDRTALVETMAAQAARLAKDPEDVVKELDAFKGNISALGNWIISISEMPLYVDSFTLYAPESGYAPKTSPFYVRAWQGLLRFLATFFVDETKIGENDGDKSQRALKVWVPTGRDQAQIVKNMADDSFIPVYNIPVEIQLIPLDVLLPATLSGSGPDVAMDMGQGSVLNFAMRNALTDMSTLDGWDEAAAKFFPSALQAGTFLNGVYGMPEREWFPMLYVRDDILAGLGIQAPETWEDFTSAMVELNIHNYDVYVPTGMTVFSSMVYQNGGSLYTGQGADYGISTGLYSDAAMKAFQDFTLFYTAYKVPVSADFANRFRTGEMPLGISDYTLYNTLELFAPEIRGFWSFHPIPGVRLPSGRIDNTTASGTNFAVILDDCKDKEAAWEFVKWWISTEVQTDYALQLEAVLGAAGRYATANPEVLMRLPWSRNAAEALLAQFEHTIGIPELPGGYMTARMVDYAFRSVVTETSAMRPKQALYMNLFALDRELTKKRAEFHLSVAENEELPL